MEKRIYKLWGWGSCAKIKKYKNLREFSLHVDFAREMMYYFKENIERKCASPYCIVLPSSCT